MMFNFLNSFIVSGFIHSLILASIIILFSKFDSRALPTIDISFLLNQAVNEAQEKENTDIIRNSTILQEEKKSTKPAVNKRLADNNNETAAVNVPVNHSVDADNDSHIHNYSPPAGAFTASISQGESAYAVKTGGEINTVKESLDISLLITSFINKIESSKHYPYIARKRGIEGTVNVFVKLNELGELTSISIKKSSGYEILDSSALSIIKKVCPFRHNAGRDISFVIPITYRLIK